MRGQPGLVLREKRFHSYENYQNVRPLLHAFPFLNQLAVSPSSHMSLSVCVLVRVCAHTKQTQKRQQQQQQEQPLEEPQPQHS